jgi:hypothetical protein
MVTGSVNTQALTQGRDDPLVPEHRPDAEAHRTQQPHPRGRIFDRLSQTPGQVVRHLFLLRVDSFGFLDVLQLGYHLIYVVPYRRPLSCERLIRSRDRGVGRVLRPRA